MMLSIMQLRRTAMVLVSAPASWHSAPKILGQVLIIWFTEAKPPWYLPTALALAFAARLAWLSVYPTAATAASTSRFTCQRPGSTRCGERCRGLAGKPTQNEEADGAVDDLMRVAESTGCTLIDGRKVSLLRRNGSLSGAGELVETIQGSDTETLGKCRVADDGQIGL